MAGHPELEGGEAACWLDRVCLLCGSFVEGEAAHCCDAQQATSGGREGERLGRWDHAVGDDRP